MLNLLHRPRPPRPRRIRRVGITVTECVISLTLLTVAAGGFAQLFTLAAAQQRAADARQRAGLALENWMEAAAQLPIDDLTDERLLALQPKDELEPLPSAEARATVVDEPGSPASKRITLSIFWQGANNTSPLSMELSSWRYATPKPTEDSP